MASQQYQGIYLGAKHADNLGAIKLHAGGVLWKKGGGSKLVDIPKTDIARIDTVRVPRGVMLSVRHKAGNATQFLGFTTKDVGALKDFFLEHFALEVYDRTHCVNGRNWGEAEIDGAMLSFLVSDRPAFEVSLGDVSNVQLVGKDQVQLSFHVDDTTREKDSLVELSLYVPPTNRTYPGDDEDPSAKVLHQKLLALADVGSGTGGKIVAFENLASQVPRGRFDCALYSTHMELSGVNSMNEFKIQYSSILRIFVLPKDNSPLVYVNIALDPPIRKGQTFYPHLLLQFEVDDEDEYTLDIDEELLSSKYEKKLEASYSGKTFEVFARCLRGLSGSKLTKPGTFQTTTGGPCIRCSMKTDEGLLYPLEKAFFYLPKPPTLIVYEEVLYVEFQRQGGGGGAASARTFDLNVHLEAQDYQFRNIPREEYTTLVNFFGKKAIRIENLRGSDPTPAQLVGSDSEEEEEDAYVRGGGADESDEEDEDFEGGETDGGSPTDDSDDSGEGSGEDSDDAPKRAKPKRKEKPALPKGGKKRAKKDPLAPKRAMGAYMFFAQERRGDVRAAHPDLTMIEIGRMLGEEWRALSAGDKARFEEKAKADAERYRREMAAFKTTQGDEGELDEED